MIGRAKNESGQTLVEFALTSLMFILVLMGVIEMGRMALVYTAVANAARAGARYAIVHGSSRSGTGVNGPSGPTCPCTQVNTVVQNFASTGILNQSNLTINVTYANSSNDPGSTVTVRVSYPYDPLVTYFTAALGSTTLSSTSQGVIAF